MLLDLHMKGVDLESGGSKSATSNWNTARERRIVTSSEIFSPDSTGRMKPRKHTTVISIDGMMMLLT